MISHIIWRFKAALSIYLLSSSETMVPPIWSLNCWRRVCFKTGQRTDSRRLSIFSKMVINVSPPSLLPKNTSANTAINRQIWTASTTYLNWKQHALWFRSTQIWLKLSLREGKFKFISFLNLMIGSLNGRIQTKSLRAWRVRSGEGREKTKDWKAGKHTGLVQANKAWLHGSL